jgi:hypothetical protein
MLTQFMCIKRISKAMEDVETGGLVDAIRAQFMLPPTLAAYAALLPWHLQRCNRYLRLRVCVRLSVGVCMCV